MEQTELFRLVRELVSSTYPDDEADLVSIRLRKSGLSIRFPVPRKSFSDSHDGLSEKEVLLLGHFPLKDSKGITSKELMRKSGYRSKSYLHKLIRSLMKKQEIEQDELKGYRRSK